MASGAVAARVVEWAGGLTEVQLPRGRSGAAPEDTAALVRAAIEQAAALERGELRRVRKAAPAKAASPAAAAALSPAGATDAAAAKTGDRAPITDTRRTTATDYAGWELALRGKKGGALADSDSDSDAGAEDEDDQWELQPVSEEERRAEAARIAAAASAEEHRERGNRAFKRGDYAAAMAAYTAGIRHLPGAALLSNRAAAALQLGLPGDALRDCRAALTFDPAHVKARVRAARALQALGELPEAVAEARAALALSPREGELKRLVRELEAAAAQSAYESGLLRVAAAVTSGADATAVAALEAELQLPAGAAAALAEVARTVSAAQRTGEADAAATPLAPLLPRLRELLRAQPRHRDLFAAAGGVAALLACYAEDNQGVLTALLDAVTSCDRGAAALAAAADAGAAASLVRALRDRRLAVITAAVDLLAVAAPASRSVRCELCAEPYAETLALMLARAPAPLAHRVVALLAALAAAEPKRVASALARHAATLAEGLARWVAPPADAKPAPPAAPQRAAVTASAALCRASEVLLRALACSRSVATALLALLRAEAACVPEARRLEFASGVALAFRAWVRAPEGAADALAATAALAALLASAPATVLPKLWDADEEAWALLLPLMDAPAPAAVSSAAVKLLNACAAAEPRCAYALAELGIAEPALALLASDAADVSACDAAAVLLSRAAGSAALARDLLRAGADDARRGLPAAAALLTAPRSSDAMVVALSVVLCSAAATESAALRYLGTERPHFGRDLVRAWYARSATSAPRDALEDVLMTCCLSSDEGAAALAADADSEQHVTTFVADLRARRAVAAMRATGGASLLNPEAIGMATPYSMADPDAPAPHPDAARAAALQGVDATALARYIGTLVPGAAASPPPGAVAAALPVIVDASGGAAALALRLAIALPGATVYAAERSRGACDRAVASAAAADARNCVPLCCDDDDESALAALPVPAHAAVAALASTWLDDVPMALHGVAAKLRAGAKLLLVEEDADDLQRAKAAAAKAGLLPFAAPELLNAYFVCVMQLP